MIPKDYKIVGSAKELHGSQIYCVSWSNSCFHEPVEPDDCVTSEDDPESEVDPSQRKSSRRYRCFATCGGNRVTIYEVEVPDAGKRRKDVGIIVRQGYIDPDEEENFYSCQFGGRSLGTPFGYGPLTPDENGDVKLEIKSLTSSKKRPRDGSVRSSEFGKSLLTQLVDADRFDGPELLCVAGTRGIIKVIDPVRKTLLSTLSGHGDDIYDLKFSPADTWLLLSASKDESLRLWNVKTSSCIAIFAGHEGHRNCVLACAWNRLGDRIATGGMDTSIKLWNCGAGTLVQKTIMDSQKSYPVPWDSKSLPNPSFRTIYEQMPYYSTTKVHTNYIDCVQFVGDPGPDDAPLLLSKDTHDCILLWQPVLLQRNREQQRLPNDAILLRSFDLTECEVWFIRFDMSPDCTLLAIGNKVGDISVWEMDDEPEAEPIVQLQHQYCTSTIRMVAFSPDNEFLVATCDDASVWLWDAVFKTKDAEWSK